MEPLRACRPWTCKGLRSLDSFGRQPARLITVNDGEAEVPALLLSRDFFVTLDRAATASHEHDKLAKKNQKETLNFGEVMDSLGGDIAILDMQIKDLKKRVRRGKAEMNEDTTRELKSLYDRKVSNSRHIKSIRKARGLFYKETDDAREKLKDLWDELDVGVSEVWRRAGFFENEVAKDYPPIRAHEILSKRYQSVRDARHRYEHYLEDLNKAFLDWRDVNGTECANQYEVDVQKDKFYDYYKIEAAQRHRELQEQEASYKKEYELCRQLGLEVLGTPDRDSVTSEQIIEMDNKAAIASFEKRNRSRVDAWRMAIPGSEESHRDRDQGYNHRNSYPEGSRQSTHPLHSGHSLSCDVPVEQFRRNINRYEELRASAQTRGPLGTGQPQVLAEEELATHSTQSEDHQPVNPARVAGHAPTSLYPPARTSMANNRAYLTPPAIFSVPPFGSPIQADGQAVVSQLKPWSSRRMTRSDDHQEGTKECRNPPQRLAGRKRKLEERKEDISSKSEPKKRKIKPSHNATSSLAGAQTEGCGVSLPPMNQYTVEPSGQQSAPQQNEPYVSQGTNVTCSGVPVQVQGSPASLPDTSGARFASRFSDRTRSDPNWRD